MLKAFKTELNPTPIQQRKIRQTIGVCRFIYNFYLSHNKEIYASEKRFVSGTEFSVWLNNIYIPTHPEYQWIKTASSKATKQAIMNADTAFRRFFNGKSKFPKYKKKKNQDVKAYFPKNNKTDWTIERHKIKIPTLGFVHLKEKGYILTKGKVTSGTVSTKAGKYFVSVLIDLPEKQEPPSPSIPGIGIDLGLKDFAICSHKEKPYKNINKTKPVKKLNKKLKREQRRLSRKYENKKKRGEKTATYSANIVKQVKKVQAVHLKLANIRTNYINKVVSELVKTKPAYITIEDLNVSGMMKNRCLSKAIAGQKFSEFRIKLTNKCKTNKIELRVVDRWYPSSKTCSHCGHIKKDLTLSDRTYICTECGLTLDRDRNACLNLANALIYKVAQ
jgi:putative transposase